MRIRIILRNIKKLQFIFIDFIVYFEINDRRAKEIADRNSKLHN